MTIIEGEAFQKEFKKLQKKYKTLPADFDVLKVVLEDQPTGNSSKHWVILKQDGEKIIFKTRMMCRALKGSSLRVIYYYDGKTIELVDLEIYFKGNKATEDSTRIEDFWKAKLEANANS
jgi:hypothetical protein